jgi:hypothetical protein
MNKLTRDADLHFREHKRCVVLNFELWTLNSETDFEWVDQLVAGLIYKKYTSKVNSCQDARTDRMFGKVTVWTDSPANLLLERESS